MNLNISDGTIIEELIQKKVLTRIEGNLIFSQSTTQTKNRQFIDIMSKKSSEQISIIIECFRESQPPVSNLLKKMLQKAINK